MTQVPGIIEYHWNKGFLKVRRRTGSAFILTKS